MSTLAIIPARLGATRLPRKPLRLLAGRPLIVRVWERVVAMNIAERVVIATDSPDVQAAATEAGAEVLLTAESHPSGTDRVAEVARQPAFRRAEVVVNVQGDEPFVSAAAVRGAMHMVSSGRFALATAACHASPKVLAQPDIVKVMTDDSGRAMYFSRSAIPFLREQEDMPARDALVRQHVGVYAYTQQALAAWVALPQHPLERVERLEQLRPLAAGWAMGVAMIDEASPGGIDTEQDLVHANARWADFSRGRL